MINEYVIRDFSNDPTLYLGKVPVPDKQKYKIAVAITVDFDANSCFPGSLNLHTPAVLERGRFGGQIGAPRVLEALNERGIRSTWFIPGHTLRTHRAICKSLKVSGPYEGFHELGAHGYIHENVSDFSYTKEEQVMKNALQAFDELELPTPVSYRSPAWDYSPNTLDILEKYGFKYDSSLMASDFYPYYAQNIWHNPDDYDSYSKPKNIIQFPPSWFLDDFVQSEFILGKLNGFIQAQDIMKRWKELFDFACTLDGACFVLTVHPQAIGRGHMIMMFKQFLDYMTSKGAWYNTISEFGKVFAPIK